MEGKVSKVEQAEQQLQALLHQSQLIQLQQQKKLQQYFSTVTIGDGRDKKATAPGGVGTKFKDSKEGGKMWTDNMMCPICMEESKNVSLDACGHTLCKGCAAMILSTSNKKCPICRKVVKAANPFYL